MHTKPKSPSPAFLPLLAVVAFGLSGVSDRCQDRRTIEQTRQQIQGHVEPHTPGSGDALEYAVPADSPIRQLLGDAPDLNRVEYVRTAYTQPSRPTAILILIPGFLGGAGTFDPIARDLVREFNGRLEVWAVDRRSSLLEDRRGALHARSGAETAADLAGVQQALAKGVRFYFPTSDLDDDGNPDGPFLLPDAVPGDGPSAFQRMEQDDLRAFGAYWGVDTYVRDWRELVRKARRIVGPKGLVLFGGHSMGTTWTGVFAAYDFDPGPGIEAGHELVDGLLLLEGGGTRAPSPGVPDLATYEAAVEDLVDGSQDVLFDPSPAPGCQNPIGCSSDIFLESLFGFVDAVSLGNAGELNGIAGVFDPDSPSIMQKTPLFGGIPVSILLQAPMTNRSLPGFFLDDEFSTNGAFSVSMGFSANATNYFNPIAFLVPGEFYLAPDEGVTRTWIDHDSPRFDPSHPDPLTCPPIPPPPFPVANVDVGETGCAIVDNGPKPPPGETGRWGVEREVTSIETLSRSLYETGNASEWYFVSGRPGIDLAFGRDSSALGAPELLNVTQNADVSAPVLAIGGSNGLATTEASFADYLGSIASTDVQVEILEGYAHLDVLTAADNDAVPIVADWIRRVRLGKLRSRRP
jgi:pimeloyl-ACP methyl ester carboxylesterase